MGYQKIINLLENTPNQPTKFRTKKWVEINDESRGTYNTNSKIKFKTSILRSNLCDYSDAQILVSPTITVTEVGPGGRNNSIHVVHKRNINNKQIDNAKYIDVVMSMYTLVEYSDNYSKH